MYRMRAACVVLSRICCGGVGCVSHENELGRLSRFDSSEKKRTNAVLGAFVRVFIGAVMSHTCGSMLLIPPSHTRGWCAGVCVCVCSLTRRIDDDRLAFVLDGRIGAGRRQIAEQRLRARFAGAVAAVDAAAADAVGADGRRAVAADGDGGGGSGDGGRSGGGRTDNAGGQRTGSRGGGVRGHGGQQSIGRPHAGDGVQQQRGHIYTVPNGGGRFIQRLRQWVRSCVVL